MLEQNHYGLTLRVRFLSVDFGMRTHESWVFALRIQNVFRMFLKIVGRNS